MAGVEIKEGFLCPMCMQDLGTVAQLTAHFEDQHANEDKDVINQIKGKNDCMPWVIAHFEDQHANEDKDVINEIKGKNDCMPWVM